jgi:hypothetical protein
MLVERAVDRLERDRGASPDAALVDDHLHYAMN